MKKFKKIIAFCLISVVTLSSSLAWKVQATHAAMDSWMKAVSIQPFSTTDYASTDMYTTLQNIKSVGANYVVLTIPYYQANRQSTDMYPSWNTPTDAALISAVNNAHALGLKVMFKPHLETDYIEWRGNINPAPQDRPAWFASYQSMLLHYGRIAQRYGVEDFCIGAELFPMTNPAYDATNTQHWKDMIHAVRNVYTGKLTYSANRDGEFDVIQFWHDLDYVGLSAYYNLYHAQNSSPEELKKSWDAWRQGVIEPVEQRLNMPIVITELGYRSIDGSYQTPWDWSKQGGFNEVDQANAYKATLEYWNNVPWVKGVAWWRWEINPNAGGQGDTDYTPQHKMAENVLKQYWAGTGTVPTDEKPDISVSATVSPHDPSLGQNAQVDVSVVNNGGTLENAIVDVEVYQNNGPRLSQQFTENQTLSKNGTKTYTIPFTTTNEGDYHVEIGVFNSNWTNNYVWNSNAAQFTSSKITVADPPIDIGGNGTSTDSGTTTPGTGGNNGGDNSTTTPQGPVELEIMAPREGVHISGTHPFQARLTNTELTDYTMYWQVDGDRLNDMYDSTDSVAHKEAMVDFTNWNWRPTGEAYVINFVAHLKDGSSLEKSVNIYPNQ